MTYHTASNQHVCRMHGMAQSEVSPICSLYRETEVEILTNTFINFAKGQRPDHYFMYGKSGVGKTFTLRHILSTLELPRNVVIVYVDCVSSGTPTSVLQDISETMGNPFASKGFAVHEIFSKIFDTLKSEKKRVVLILDDFDRLSDLNGLLGLFANANDSTSDTFQVITVSDSLSSLMLVDSKVKSSLFFKLLCFSDHSEEQIAAILRSVHQYDLAEIQFGLGALEEIARIGSSSTGNVKIAITLLLECAKFIRSKGLEMLEIEHIREVYSNSSLSINSASNEDLSREESMILEMLKEGELPSSRIYESFQLQVPFSKRQIRNFLANLEKKGKIESKSDENSALALKPKRYRLK